MHLCLEWPRLALNELTDVDIDSFVESGQWRRLANVFKYQLED